MPRTRSNDQAEAALSEAKTAAIELATRLGHVSSPETWFEGIDKYCLAKTCDVCGAMISIDTKRVPRNKNYYIGGRASFAKCPAPYTGVTH